MRRKGTYVLDIALGTDRDIPVGALGTLHFPKGHYCYVGSALGGIDARVGRHLSKDKCLRWHIDHLTVGADRVTAYISCPDHVPECELARMAEGCGMVPVHKGFGCSDCGCPTHLFLITEGSLDRLLEKAGLMPFQ